MTDKPLPLTLRSLTGLRALAAGAVFLRHSGYLFDHTSLRHVTLRLFVQGGVGVSFFFVLSGFVLTWSWRPGVIAFYRRRFARIYPAYLASTIAAAGLIWLIGGTVSTTAVVAVLLLSQSWFSSPSVFNALNSVSWSLSCEAFFYLLFPALIFAAVRLPVGVRRLAFAALVFDVIAIPTWVFGPNVWLDYIFPPTRLLEFLCGMLLALEVKSGRWPRVRLAVAWPIAITGYLLAGEAGHWALLGLTGAQGYAAVTIVPFLILIGAYATRDVAGEPTRMGSAVAVRLGEISYAFYLVHYLLIRLFAHYTGSWRPTLPEALATVFALLAAAFVTSATLFFVVERPAERRLRPALRRREAVAV